jgi:hypothetical protein
LAYSSPQIKNDDFLSQRTITTLWAAYASVLIVMVLLWLIDHYELKFIAKKHAKVHR